VPSICWLPPGQEPCGIDRIEARPLTEQEIGQRLRGITAPPAPGSLGTESDELRFFVAGAQEKTAFLLHNGQWCLPLASTPTTHLFTLPMGIIGEGQIDFTTSVENEWLCSRILDAFGLPVAHTEMASFDGERCLIVHRFDRRLHASGCYWLRLPTEDCCQATSTPAANKYENNGGPGMVAIAALLAQSSERQDLTTFFKAQVLFWMLRAIDGHAKNFSLFLTAGGRFQLTPLYDVLSAWPVIGRRSGQWPQQKLKKAMAWHGEKGRYTKPLEITARRMLLTAKRLGLADAAGPADPLHDPRQVTPLLLVAPSLWTAQRCVSLPDRLDAIQVHIHNFVARQQFLNPWPYSGQEVMKLNASHVAKTQMNHPRRWCI